MTSLNGISMKCAGLNVAARDGKIKSGVFWCERDARQEDKCVMDQNYRVALRSPRVGTGALRNWLISPVYLICY